MAAAMSEMFVHRSNRDVYLAYGIPKEWKAASCYRMVIEGGHKISMELENYQVKRVVIEAGATEQLNFHFADYANFEGPGNTAIKSGSICVNGEERGGAEAHALCLKKGEIYQITVNA